MFQDNLKKLRLEKGYTQADLANVLYVTQQAVSLWETGKGYPDVPTLKQLAKILGTNVDSLIGVEEYNAAMEEKRIHRSPLLWTGVIFAGLLSFLVVILLVISQYADYKTVSVDVLLGFLLAFLVALIPLLILIYQKKRNVLAIMGLVSFTAITTAFLGLALGGFALQGASKAGPWEWLCGFLVAGIALGFFIFWYARSQKNPKVLDEEDSLSPKKPYKSAWIWTEIALGVAMIVFLFIPWRYFDLNVYDSLFGGDPKKVVGWLSLWAYNQSLDPLAYSFNFIELACYLGLVVCAAMCLFPQITGKARKGLSLASVILTGLCVVVLLLSVSFYCAW
jgi:transcriptional regulator with XRE-family HTH domain